MAGPKPPPANAGFLQRTLRLGLKAARGALTPSLVSYFFWCGILCCCIGLWSYVEVETLGAFLCAIPAQLNETAKQIVGCEKCADTLLLCDKQECWRQAVNYTYQADALTSDDPYFDDFQEAALDTVCNQLVLDSKTPAEMLANIITKKADATATEKVTSSCTAIHCRVFMNIINNTDLSGPAPCTNNLQIKPEWQSEECTCSSLNVMLSEAFDYQKLCGAMASALPALVSRRIVEGKPTCLRDSIRIAAAAFPSHFTVFLNNINCSFLLQNARFADDWWQGRQEYNAAAADKLLPFAWYVPDSCDRIMCTSFQKALNLTQCNWAQDQEFQDLDSAFVTDYILPTCNKYSDMRNTLTLFCKMCARAPALPSCIDICDTSPDDTSTTAAGGSGGSGGGSATAVTTTTRTSGTTAAGGGAVSRRLHSNEQLLLPPPGLQTPKCKGSDMSTTSDPRRLQDAATDTTAAPGAAATPTADPNAQDWTVSDWSKCTCLQQCVPGVKIRSVTCPAGVVCKKPEPASAMTCVCKHCANCSIDWMNWAFFFMYGAQGVLSLFMWLAFWKVSMLEEDDLSDMRCATKCLGFFCKFLPVTLRIFTYAELVLVIWNFAVSTIPLGEFESDCRAFLPAQLHSAANLVIWLLQLAFGIYMKRNKPMPPWLYNAVPDGIVKILCGPLRAIGP